MKEEHSYRGDGAIYRFNTYIGEYHGETRAVSEKEAKSNLEYQIKSKMGLLPTAKINFKGKITRTD